MNVLKLLYKGWMRFAHALGIVNTYILLTVFFGVILLPFGVVTRLYRATRRRNDGWVLRDRKAITLADLRRLF
jgi:Saxitoxin biosynthesis operon protein SxtJ